MFPFTLKCLHLDNKSYDQPNSSQSGRGIQDFLAEIEIETTGSQVQLVRKTKTNSGNETLGCYIRCGSGLKDYKFTIQNQSAHLLGDIV